ncbi:MAG: amidase [Actinobacteria bacterium]|nr:amidase [Actinomycetota bacterium]
MAALHDLTALEQAAAIRSGQTSAVELTQHYLDRSEHLSDQIGAFVIQTPDIALDQARAADGQVRIAQDSDQLPPLFGVVCPVKDLDFVAGVQTRLGSAALDITPFEDDNVIAKMRAAGLVFTGKTNTPELGLPCYTEPDVAPPARTPWDLERSAGGSSGGAAAAVSAGLAPIAHGSDGGGSIRIPSSVTGLVGIKPTRGRISNGPMRDSIGDLATHGPIGRNVADTAALLDVMAGGFPGDPFSARGPIHGTFLDAARREPGRLRIGFYSAASLSDVLVHAEVVDALNRTVELLESLGHEVVEVAPPFSGGLLEVFGAVWSTLALLTPLASEDEGTLRPLTRYLRDRGREVSGIELGRAVSMMRTNSRAAMEASAHVDVVLAPTLADLPAFVGQLRNDDDPAAGFAAQVDYSPFCAAYNVTGQPAINVPLNWSEHTNLPIGVQLVGRMHDEETIISLAGSLQRARDWTTRHPAIW